MQCTEPVQRMCLGEVAGRSTGQRWSEKVVVAAVADGDTRLLEGPESHLSSPERSNMIRFWRRGAGMAAVVGWSAVHHVDGSHLHLVTQPGGTGLTETNDSRLKVNRLYCGVLPQLLGAVDVGKSCA